MSEREAIAKLANEIGRLYLSLTFVRQFQPEEIERLRFRVDEMRAIVREFSQEQPAEATP